MSLPSTRATTVPGGKVSAAPAQPLADPAAGTAATTGTTGEGPALLSFVADPAGAAALATTADLAGALPRSGRQATVRRKAAHRAEERTKKRVMRARRISARAPARHPQQKASGRPRVCRSVPRVNKRRLALLLGLSAALACGKRGQAPATATVVALHESAPLAEVLGSSLKFSNNFTSEQVLRTLGWRLSGEPGSWAHGRAAVLAAWTALGQDPADLEFENGAGLSRSGRVSPRALVGLLARTRQEGTAAAALMPTMASAGGEGTLRRRLTASDGRVRGKTGTISGVSALSGVAASADGQSALGFSVLINGEGAANRHRRLQDRVVLTLLGHLDRPREVATRAER